MQWLPHCGGYDGYVILSTLPLLHLAEITHWKAKNYISQKPLQLSFVLLAPIKALLIRGTHMSFERWEWGRDLVPEPPAVWPGKFRHGDIWGFFFPSCICSKKPSVWSQLEDLGQPSRCREEEESYCSWGGQQSFPWGSSSCRKAWMRWVNKTCKDLEENISDRKNCKCKALR